MKLKATFFITIFTLSTINILFASSWHSTTSTTSTTHCDLKVFFLFFTYITNKLFVRYLILSYTISYHNFTIPHISYLISSWSDPITATHCNRRIASLKNTLFKYTWYLLNFLAHSSHIFLKRKVNISKIQIVLSYHIYHKYNYTHILYLTSHTTNNIYYKYFKKCQCLQR